MYTPVDHSIKLKTKKHFFKYFLNSKNIGIIDLLSINRVFMYFTNLLQSPGEHNLVFQGQAGSLEAILTVPDRPLSSHFALIGHPHSLQGGTMNNKVVTTLARAFRALEIVSLRFNFRGVGRSVGVYDAGLGESEDMLLLAKLWQEEQPQAQCIFSGFSFGSYVAYRAASQYSPSPLITIAPPVHHYNYTEFSPAPNPWLIIQGLKDEVVPSSLVLDFVQPLKTDVQLVEFADTGHFFHGKLLELKDSIMQAVTSWIKPL